VKPIAHLYKTQVYDLAEHLGIPDEIRTRPPTTDTWSMPQSQEEFYFAVPFAIMDVCLGALNSGASREETAAASGLTVPRSRQSGATSRLSEKSRSICARPP
jgi:NAD+ synthase